MLGDRTAAEDRELQQIEKKRKQREAANESIARMDSFQERCHVAETQRLGWAAALEVVSSLDTHGSRKPLEQPWRAFIEEHLQAPLPETESDMGWLDAEADILSFQEMLPLLACQIERATREKDRLQSAVDKNRRKLKHALAQQEKKDHAALVKVQKVLNGESDEAEAKTLEQVPC